MAAYANHSCKRPAPVTEIFIASRGCPLPRASTVVLVNYLTEKLRYEPSIFARIVDEAVQGAADRVDCRSWSPMRANNAELFERTLKRVNVKNVQLQDFSDCLLLHLLLSGAKYRNNVKKIGLLLC